MNKTAIDGLNEGLLQHSCRVIEPMRAPAGSLNKTALYTPVWRNLERSKPKMATEKTTSAVTCGESESCSVVPDSATPRTVPARLLCPGGSPGKNTGVGCHALL